MKERGPIFYDAQRVRWRLTRRTLEISGALLTLLLTYFFITIAVSVELRPAAGYKAGPARVEIEKEAASRARGQSSSRLEPGHRAG
jgi:hypothetical protein